MLHPIFSTVVSRPDLVVDHLAAYVDLATQEATSTGNDLLVRVAGAAVAGLLAFLFLGLAGVALMLGLVQGQFHWAFAAVPGAALLLAGIVLLATRRPPPGRRFAELRRQFAADLGLLRTSGDPHGS